MAKKQTQPEQADTNAETGTVEAVEAEGAQPGVDTTTDEVEDADDSAPKPTGYLVQWSIKTGGKRYDAGDVADMTAEQAAPFLATGAIKKGG